MAASRLHSHHSLPAPVVHAGFSVPQSKSHVLAGVQDAYWSDDEAEDAECPLCLEEMDISDLNFKPCICGYQICRFCWHHIKENLNKRCPACRRAYTDDAVEFKPIASQDHKRLTQQKKQRERERKELEALGRRQLANVRVVQRNVVYVVGIGPRFAKEELIPTLRSHEYFGQYGKITKILLVKRTPSGGGAPVVGLYITYHRREDAARAIAAVDGAPSPGGGRGEVMRASYGTTKYCMAFLRGVSCSDHSCMNLHEWGDEKDCFTKEDLTTLKHTMKTTESRGRNTVVTYKKGDEQDAGLPRAASWAQKPVNLQTSTAHLAGTAVTARQGRRAARQPRSAQAAGPPTAEPRPSVTRIFNQESRVDAVPKAPSQASSSRPATPASSVAPQRVTSLDMKDPKYIQPTKESPPQEPSHPPDLSTRTGEPESRPPSLVSPSPAPRPESTDSARSSIAQPVLPPGLPVAPPGLSAPRGIPSPGRPPRAETASPQTPLLASQSSYQMSTAARALLDDVTARRESGFPAAMGVSPFPDFDRTLQTLSGGEDGGFSFNLDPNLAGSNAESLAQVPDFEAEACTPFQGSYFDAFPALRTPAASGFMAPPGLPFPHQPSRSIYDPHAVRAPPATGLESKGPGLSYLGSFNPFAETSEEPSVSTTAPLGRPQHSSLDDDSGRKMSRFGFARGKQSSTATSSPLHVSSPLSNGSIDGQSFFNAVDGLSGPGRTQWPTNARQDYGFTQSASNTSSPLVQHAADPTSSLPQNRFQPFETSVSEAQLREFIQASRQRAQPSLLSSADSHPPGLKANTTHFTDPAIMSARLATSGPEGTLNQLSYGPPPGLVYPQGGPPISSGIVAGNGLDSNGSAHVSATASPSPSLALSSVDFPALTASPVEPSSREETSTAQDSGSQLDAKAREKAERKAVKKAAAAEKAAERQRIAQEKAAIKAAERAKAAQEKQVEKERAMAEKEKAMAIKAQEKLAKEQAEKEKAEKERAEKEKAEKDKAARKAESERLAKERAAQAEREKSVQVKKVAGNAAEDKRSNLSVTKASRSPAISSPAAVPKPSEPEVQVPLLSKKPKKNKPAPKPIRILKDEGPTPDDTSTVPSLPTSEVPLMPTDSSSANSRSHSLDRSSPTPIEDLLEEIHMLNPVMDLPNHPFFDTHKLSPAATVPLEYGPLVHALSALSVGGGSFANNMPSGSIDNAVSSFQQLLETLTQTISDLLRLLPRTTWDDSSSFDGVLRDMLKGDDFLDDGGDDGHGKEDEVAALTLALERRARWMEVQLSKLEELHRDINTAAVRAVLAFNDNGWDRRGCLPRVGNTLHRFDNIGLVEEDGAVRSMTADGLEKKLAVAKEAAVFAETEVREVMERMRAIKPVDDEF
ncbi:putative RNA recognition motif containing protein [Lyophyllum shimeji]|uniref:RNA recognition motif containing protein n=1 Tax=Lyophyllum shimeji TaxID=47721 RepID=A0A9P3PGI5_LYOSH|nr:putative RNA recognition motif containing protein [Lyophyllum shimeji]